MPEIVSSTIQRVDYDAEKSVLRVTFHNSGVYDYARVPEGVYKALVTAPSAGAFLNRNIRNKYPTTRVR